MCLYKGKIQGVGRCVECDAIYMAERRYHIVHVCVPVCIPLEGHTKQLEGSLAPLLPCSPAQVEPAPADP